MQKWGIWGFGLVGKSAIRYLHSEGHALSVLDKRVPTPEERVFLGKHQVRFYAQEDRERFFQDNDYILPSPGIECSQVESSKYVQELDLFLSVWKKPIIGVTGSLGKTTLVTLLDQLFAANSMSVATGGNIGVPMLDLISQQSEVDYALLELSSFQLAKAHPFSPLLAILTNFYPNHLDRHKTLDEYFAAKYQLFSRQRPDQRSLVPLALAPRFREQKDRPLTCFSSAPTQEELSLIREGDVLYTYKEEVLVKKVFTDGTYHEVAVPYSKNTQAVLPETWLCALAACDMLGLTSSAAFRVPHFSVPEHRIEFLGAYNDRLYYNDSKATIGQATKAAVTTLSGRPIHVLLGGLAKGVDRKHGIKDLKQHVASIACFGQEAEMLHALCVSLNIPSSMHPTLENALNACQKRAQSGEIILLSPGGTSFDLYSDYKERGNHFKTLVQKST